MAGVARTKVQRTSMNVAEHWGGGGGKGYKGGSREEKVPPRVEIFACGVGREKCRAGMNFSRLGGFFSWPSPRLLQGTNSVNCDMTQ